MNHLDLSQRLAAVGEFVPRIRSFSRHWIRSRYLPVASMLRGKIEYAVAGEVVQGPMNQHVSKSKKMDWKTVSPYVLQMV